MSRNLQNWTIGDDVGLHDSVSFRIYVGQSTDSRYGQSSYDHTKSTLDEATNKGWIAGYELYWYTTTFDPLCDGETILSQMETWREQNGYTEQGMHVLINDCNDDDATALGTTDGNNPWSQEVDAHTVTRLDDRAEDQVKDSVVHEAMHAWSRNECPYCTNMMVKEQDGTGYNEHSLGTVFENLHGLGARWESPIGEGDYSIKNGECSNAGGNASNITSKPSDCEMKAMHYGADHTAGQHNH